MVLIGFYILRAIGTFNKDSKDANVSFEKETKSIKVEFPQELKQQMRKVHREQSVLKLLHVYKEENLD